MSLLHLQQLEIEVNFCWVHVGIEGNEVTDKLTKSTFNKNDILEISFGRSEAKSVIQYGIMTSWQNILDNENKDRNYNKVRSDET